MKTYYFLFLLVLLSCESNHKTTLSGVIENPKSKYVHLTIGDSLLTQKLDETNSFKFYVDIDKSGYYRFDCEEHTSIYLTSGKNLQLKLDAKRFDESLQYFGDLANENNYIAWRIVEFEKVKDIKYNLYNLKLEDYQKFIDSTATNLQNRLSTFSNPDSIFYLTEKEKIEEFKESYLDNYNKMQHLQKGDTAPDFICKDKNGNSFTLDKFKGNPLCIDVWATWCTGCLKEMPVFDSLKEKYSNDIKFISVSIDDDKDKWNEMVQKKNMEGIQLWAENGKKSEFVTNYYLQECGVPCFILIDKDGKIINARASRPSENLKELLINMIKHR